MFNGVYRVSGHQFDTVVFLSSLSFVNLKCKLEEIGNVLFTGKYLSEALLFAEHFVYKNCSECQNFCTQHILPSNVIKVWPLL